MSKRSYSTTNAPHYSKSTREAPTQRRDGPMSSPRPSSMSKVLSSKKNLAAME